MTFNTYFRVSSHAMIACGALALMLAGGMGAGLTAVFAVVLVAAWKFEGKKWQLSERTGLVAVLLALPLFYVDWKFQAKGEGVAGISALVHLTLFLSSVKLLQVKADRDWLFLYLISFFEVLLAAGLSLSPLFIAALTLYMFCALSTFVCFEIRKSSRIVPHDRGARLLIAPDSTLMRRFARRRRGTLRKVTEVRRLPLVALCLLLLIFALALPIFFIAPRFSESSLTRADGGTTNMVGFSDEVTLGDFGRLQQNDRTVMRVRVEEPLAERNQRLRWRGVALDHFNGRAWRKSTSIYDRRVEASGPRGFFRLNTTEDLDHLTTQTFFVEPIDTPVLFVAPQPVALQGALPFVRRDGEDALFTRMHPQERITYRVYSDTVEPPSEVLRADRQPYAGAASRYLQLPSALDPRIGALAREVIGRTGARNRYDAALAIEAHLKNDYGYTLDMRAGGLDPLADFLFRVRAGHCEYFSTAMAVMLRAEGIATRVVNGFQTGQYNDAADAYTVKQQDAHSWVEVYFPETDAWVTFDPTPAVGRLDGLEAQGLRAQIRKYTEALELFWIQYVVAYDQQGQRSLASSLRDRVSSQRRTISRGMDDLKVGLLRWWRGITASEMNPGYAALVIYTAPALFLAALVAVLIFLTRRIRRLGFKRGFKLWRNTESAAGPRVISFYDRMTKSLESRGLRRAIDQTPLEFATAIGIPEALTITRAYHRVRYGDEQLSPNEGREIEEFLQRMEVESNMKKG